MFGCYCFFFFKQKTAYEMRISDWSSDVCSSDLGSIYLDGNVLDADGLAREADARRRAGFEVELLKPAAVLERYGIKGRHALIGFGNYSADPRRMTLGYLNAAIARGARLYSPVDICDIDAREIGRAHV